MDFMLWYQDDKTPLAERVSKAAAHYLKKYGRAPTSCLVPKGTDTTGVTELTCDSDPAVPASHLFVGSD